MFATEYPVSNKDVQFFRDNGYVQLDNVLSADEVIALQGAVDRARGNRQGRVRDLAGNCDGEKILQMLNLWEYHPEVEHYLRGGRLARMAAALAGSSSIHLYHDQALVKEPGPSAASPWHQDQPYWPSKEHGMFSCWMALDDVTIERGCMQFIAGSHKWGEFSPVSFQGEGAALRDQLSPEQEARWNPVAVPLKAGSCTFHHGLTFHYTRPNTTDHVRRALVAIFIPDGVNYAAEDKMDSPFDDSITSKKGEPLRGKHFVQLYPAT